MYINLSLPMYLWIYSWARRVILERPGNCAGHISSDRPCYILSLHLFYSCNPNTTEFTFGRIYAPANRYIFDDLPCFVPLLRSDL
jgi:hypothetical protein